MEGLQKLLTRMRTDQMIIEPSCLATLWTLEKEVARTLGRHVHLPASRGYLFSQAKRFNQAQIEMQLRQVMLDRTLYSNGWLRAKVIFHCQAGFALLNVDIVGEEIVCS